MIPVEEFVERVIRLGVRPGPRRFPRGGRDRQILAKSILLLLDSGRSYSESELNGEILAWKRDVAPAIETDHVTIRRTLIDEGLLERTADGGTYRVGFPRLTPAFALEVDALDIRATIAAYRMEHG